MLTAIQKLALAKLNVKSDRSQVEPGTYQVAPFTVTVGGTLSVSPDEVYTPTVDIPLIPTVALALKKMGIQREHFLKVMRESVSEVILADREMRATLIAQAGLAEFEADFRQQVLAQLPNKTRAGKVNADLRITPAGPGLLL